MSLPVIVQQLVAQLYFLDYKRDTPAFAMLFPLLGLARDFPRLDSAHAKRTKRELAVQVFHVSQGRVSFGLTLLYSF